jgi:2-oxoglutarate ferredoxin oxidoreductase subunit gamma
MRSEVVFAGFGGQGIVKAAFLLTTAAGLYEEKEVAQTQSYGPEARGGSCHSEVVISDDTIDYIKARRIDILVVMSQPAMDKYLPVIDTQRAIVIADTTLVRALPEPFERFYPVEATRVAEQALGRALFANIILLGSLSSITRLVSLDSLERALVGNVPKKTLDQNRSALKLGYELGAELASAGTN